MRLEKTRFKLHKRLWIRSQEKYSRGRRGAPAKGIGRVTGARVQIPPSPFEVFRFLKKLEISKKYLTFRSECDKVNELLMQRQITKSHLKSLKKLKKVLDKQK